MGKQLLVVTFASDHLYIAFNVFGTGNVMITKALLRHPCVKIDEGPNAYLLRLAEANQVMIRDLRTIGIAFTSASLTELLRNAPEFTDGLHAYIDRIEIVRDKCPTIWNTKSCRYCPACIASGGYWHVGWEILFFDACPMHKCWLVDRCDLCGDYLSWDRARLHQCNCGHQLGMSHSHEAPDTVIQLSQQIHRSLLNAAEGTDQAPFVDLDVEQMVRLIRFMGAYGQSAPERLPQKVRNAGSMDVSWQFTSIAAELLFKWPQNFERSLHGLLEQSVQSVGQRFPARFGFYYSLLYRRFGDPEFHQLRTAFENFVAQHWHGPIAKRNRRLSDALLERTAWVSANHARRQLQVSASRLGELVQSGVVVGEERLSETGRRYLVVHKESIQAMRPVLDDEVDLSTASEMLGLTRARLRSALARLFPGARKIEGDANRWAISRTEVEKLVQLGSASVLYELENGQVSLEHILRFWCCSEEEITSVLVSLRDGTLQPVGRLEPGAGLHRLVFLVAQVRQMVETSRGKHQNKFTIPELAAALNVKQEVAYFLIRQGLFASDTAVIGRRTVSLVTREGLDAFRARYVFARDLAKLRKTSSRTLQLRLAEINIYPVMSPMQDTCRQVIYERKPELEEIFPQLIIYQKNLHCDGASTSV